MKSRSIFLLEGIEREKFFAIAAILISLADLATMDICHEQKHHPIPGKDYNHVNKIVKITTLASLSIALYNTCSTLGEHIFR